MLRATAPLVIAKSNEGADLYVYEGGIVPSGQSDEWVAAHLRDGMVEEAGDVVETDDGTGKPGGNASHEEWVAYAVSQGVEHDEAEAMSRNDLRDLYS